MLWRVKLSEVCTLSLGSNEVSERSVGVMPRTQSVLFYQLDFKTPGISPLRASERKQRRHTPNLRRKARGRPQSWQRLCWRDLNFGVFASLTRFAVVAMFLLSIFDCKLVRGRWAWLRIGYAPTRKGIPKPFSKARAPLSSVAVVTIVTFMPFNLSTFA